jgi:hypothetical protein
LFFCKYEIFQLQNLKFFPYSTYTRVFNLWQNIDSKFWLRLICGSTYTRVYTVVNRPTAVQGLFRSFLFYKNGFILFERYKTVRIE